MADSGPAGHLRTALTLGRRGLGATWPNPAVGCVIVDETDGPAQGRIIARGWTGDSGIPHAETEALARAGADARGATAYVTLEPCTHSGRTPPCIDALIAAGVDRVVIALTDPDPRMQGRGIAALEAAGITVLVADGASAAEAARDHAGHVMRQRAGRPLVTLKTATTLDGRIAVAGGESQWITGPAARRRGHLMRAEHDAVMIGIGTAHADDPQLTCRLPGLEARSPVRIVIDPRLELPLDGKLATGDGPPVWLVASAEAAKAGKDRVAACRAAGLCVIEAIAAGDGQLAMSDVLRQLGGKGLTRVLVEGGSGLSAGLMRERLVDRIAWFRASTVAGGDGLAAVGAVGIDRLRDMPRFERLSLEKFGEDVLEIFERIDDT